MVIRRVAVMLLPVVVGVACSSPGTDSGAAPPPAPAAPVERPSGAVLVEEASRVRVERGLPPLAVDAGLATFAEERARVNADVQSMVHADAAAHVWPNPALGYLWIWAEVLATGGCSIRPSTIVAGWLNSPDHAAVLLDPRLRVAGAATVCADDGRAWTAMELGAS